MVLLMFPLLGGDGFSQTLVKPMNQKPTQKKRTRAQVHQSNHPNDVPIPHYFCSTKFNCALYGRMMKPSTARKINVHSGCSAVGIFWMTLPDLRRAGFTTDPSSLLVTPLTSVNSPSKSGVNYET